MCNCARLDLEMEKAMYPGNDSNVVSAMSFAREQSMSISSPWPSLSFTQESLKAHWPLTRTNHQVMGSPCRRQYFECQRQHRISTHILPARIYHLDLLNNILVVGMASPISYMRYPENGSACADEGQ